MTALENEAVSLGFSMLERGTGGRQPEAVALYEATGWERHQVNADAAPLPPGVIRFTKLVS